MPNKLSGAIFIAVNLVLSVTGFAKAEDTPRYAFPQHIAYAPQTIKPNHVSQAQLDEHVRAYYNHWKAHYLIRESGASEKKPLYRVSYGSANPEKTVSEGQGYGMVIVALMAGYDANAREIFDGLFLFSRQHPSRIDKRLMSWECKKNSAQTDSAFDGDVDIAYGLLLADRQWGSAGQINYQASARNVITAILESTIGAESRLPLLGDSVNYDNNKQHNQYTPRSSDFMLAHFKAFGRFTGNAVWNQVVSQSQSVIDAIQCQYSPKTGLLPDFITSKKPAPRHFLEGEHDGDFYYNAGRVPLRLGIDVLLNNDALSRKQVQKMSTWLQASTKGDPQKIKPGYKLDGMSFSDEFVTFFVAPFGVAAMTDPNQQAWLNAIYDTVYNKHQEYYADSVTLLSLLAMTGNYWDPTTVQ